MDSLIGLSLRVSLSGDDYLTGDWYLPGLAAELALAGDPP
jgi:hypothetical protein